MNLKGPFPDTVLHTSHVRRLRGPKAFLLEPLLIVGAFLLWLLILPLAMLVWSGNTLMRRVHPAGQIR